MPKININPLPIIAIGVDMSALCMHYHKLRINPLPTIGNSLKKQKSLYKVLAPSIKPMI